MHQVFPFKNENLKFAQLDLLLTFSIPPLKIFQQRHNLFLHIYLPRAARIFK